MSGPLLHHSLRDSASNFPDRFAYRSPSKEITYKELDDLSNRLAEQLLEFGVRQGDRVGILMDRCVESPIAVYAILRLGAVFVPIDPFAPQNRNSFVVNDCGISVILTTEKWQKVVDELSSSCKITAIVGCDSAVVPSCSWSTIEERKSSHYHMAEVGEDSMAYIMYTSGSTGKPKGIMHSHFSGYSYARLSRDLYEITEEDILASHSPLHFDMSTLAYLTSPLAGSCAVIIPEMHTKMPASMSSLIERFGITIWYSVPLALIQMLDHGILHKRDSSTLRYILYGGEPFAPKHITALMDRIPSAKFSNVYGPAEVNQCTYYDIPRFPNQAGAVPLGHVWAETKVLITNEEGKEVEINEVGELLVNSPTRMLGYWNAEQLTASKIFEDDSGQLFYQTGDLVKKGEDGLLHFMGRKDRQVKIRGNRIEPSEIEALLQCHSAIADVAVYVSNDESDDRKLLASIVSNNAKINEEEVKEYIRRELPIYAIPSSIEFTAEIPRTAAGKIDYKLLVSQFETKD